MNHTLQQVSQWRAVTSVTVLVALLAWEGWHPFFGFFAGQARERFRHGLRNLLLGVVNSTLAATGFVAWWTATAAWAQSAEFGLLNLWPLPGWARLAATFLLYDAWMYGWHRLNHALPFLWRFHRAHHSDPRMDVTTATRFHAGEIVLSAILRVPVIALLGLRLGELAAYELAMFAVAQFHHANIGWPPWLDRWFRVVFVSPFLHKVHHSRWQPETDSNYSALFSFWDRFFRTFRLSKDPHALRFGLDEFDRPADQTLWGMVATPVQPSFRITRARRRAPDPPGR